jgi:protoheme IX farnesyltransferase
MKDSRRSVRHLALSGVVLFGAQVAVGGANVLTDLAPAAVLGHAALSFAIWGTYVALTVTARRAAPVAVSPRSALRGSVLSYVALTKPRIIVLLLVTTVPAMVLAAGGLPSLWLVLATLSGGMITAGSANAFNQYLERDIDAAMDRTRSRPLPKHSIEPTRALLFAVALGFAGFAWLALVVNLLSAILAASAIVFYVVVYTILLKRSTPQNIVIGGAAGAVPVLVGWAAVTGTVAPAAWVMFAIIFFWTPPHFWALAMRYRDDYERAGVPMLPVVRGVSSVTAQILAYAIVLVAVTLLLSPVAGLGALYASAATVLGVGFIYRALRLRGDPSGATAFKLFRYSVTYLAVLFAAMAVDRLIW